MRASSVYCPAWLALIAVVVVVVAQPVPLSSTSGTAATEEMSPPSLIHPPAPLSIRQLPTSSSVTATPTTTKSTTAPYVPVTTTTQSPAAAPTPSPYTSTSTSPTRPRSPAENPEAPTSSTTATAAPRPITTLTSTRTVFATAAPSAASGDDNSMGDRLSLYVPLVFGLFLLGALVWWIAFGPGRRYLSDRARSRRLASIARLTADAGLTGSDTSSTRGTDENLQRSSAAAVAARRGRAGRGTPPRRTESGRSVRTLPVYTSEAGDEEIVLLQRDRSLRMHAHAHAHALSLGTLDENDRAEAAERDRDRAQDDRYSVDMGWPHPPSYFAPPYDEPMDITDPEVELGDVRGSDGDGDGAQGGGRGSNTGAAVGARAGPAGSSGSRVQPRTPPPAPRELDLGLSTPRQVDRPSIRRVPVPALIPLPPSQPPSRQSTMRSPQPQSPLVPARIPLPPSLPPSRQSTMRSLHEPQAASPSSPR